MDVREFEIAWAERARAREAQLLAAPHVPAALSQLGIVRPGDRLVAFADDFADARCVRRAPELEGFAECAHGAASHGAAERHFAYYAGKAEEHYEEQVRDKEGRSAKL